MKNVKQNDDIKAKDFVLYFIDGKLDMYTILNNAY